MTTRLIRGALTVLLAGLAGCGGQPLFLAGAALDGASLVATGKSLGGHGLSALSGEDCDPARAFAGEPLCRPRADAAVVAPAPAPSALAAIYLEAAGAALVAPPYRPRPDPAKLGAGR